MLPISRNCGKRYRRSWQPNRWKRQKICVLIYADFHEKIYLLTWLRQVGDGALADTTGCRREHGRPSANHTPSHVRPDPASDHAPRKAAGTAEGQPAMPRPDLA